MVELCKKIVTLSLSFVWFLFFMGTAVVSALQFSHSAVYLEAPTQDMTLADLNDNGLQDVLIVTGNSFMVFFQREGSGFSKYPDQTLEFTEEVRVVDIGEVDPTKGKEIIYMGRNGTFYYKQRNGRFLPDPDSLIKEATFFLGRQFGCYIVDFAKDLNSDGLDDLLVPTEEGMVLYWQSFPGRFTRYGPLPTRRTVYASVTAFLWPSSLTEKTQQMRGLCLGPEIREEKDLLLQDINNDGLVDILLPDTSGNEKDSGPHIFLQTRDGRFMHGRGQDAEIYGEALAEEGELFFFDINGNGLMDKVIVRMRDPLQNSSLMVPTIQIAIFLNKDHKGFMNNPDHVFRSVYLSDFVPIVDIDKDNTQDIFTIYADLRIGSKESIIQSLTRKAVSFVLRCYLFDNQKQSYPYSSDVAHNFVVKYGDSTNIASVIFFDLSGDFDGNGIHDFVYREKADTLLILLMEKRDGELNIFDEIRIPIPDNTAHIKVIQLNGDNRSDLILLDQTGTRLSILINQG